MSVEAKSAAKGSESLVGNKTHRILKSSFMITLISLLTSFVGFLTSVVLAAAFGAGEEMDALFIAQTLPLLLQAMVLTAANFSIIPVFAELEHNKDSAGAAKAASSLINLFVLSLMVLTAGMMLAHTGVLKAIAPGLPDVTRASATTLLLIQTPAVFFLGMAGLLSSIQSAERRYFLGPISTLLGSVLTFIVICVFKKSAGIDAAAYAFLAGAVISLLYLLPPHFKRYSYAPIFSFKGTAAGAILWLMLPLLLGSMFYRAEGLIQRFVAASLPPGSISCLGYGFKVMSLFATVLSSGLPVVALSHYSAQLRSNDVQGLTETFNSVFKWMSSLVLCCVVLIFVCGNEIIQILFMRGRFDLQAASLTHQCLIFYSGVLISGVLGSLITPVFYAHKDVKTAVLFGVGGALLHAALCLLLAPLLSVIGLPLAHSVSNCLAVGGMLVLLSYKHLPVRLLPLLRVLVACALAAVLAIVVCSMLKPRGFEEINVWIRLTLKTGTAVIVYVVVACALGMANALAPNYAQMRCIRSVKLCSLAGS